LDFCSKSSTVILANIASSFAFCSARFSAFLTESALSIFLGFDTPTFLINSAHLWCKASSEIVRPCASTDSETYKNALADLIDAQDEQVKAIDDVRSAKERELEVTRNLVKAEILLRKAKGKLTKKQIAAADKLLADLNTPVTVDVPTRSAPASTGFSVAGIDFSGVDFSGINVGGLATLASGGVVKASSGGTLALIGEGGEDEAVIPLSQLGSSGGAGINVYITAGVGDPNEIGRQVVNALQAYQRRNGAIPVKVQ